MKKLRERTRWSVTSDRIVFLFCGREGRKAAGMSEKKGREERILEALKEKEGAENRQDKSKNCIKSWAGRRGRDHVRTAKERKKKKKDFRKQRLEKEREEKGKTWSNNGIKSYNGGRK